MDDINDGLPPEFIEEVSTVTEMDPDVAELTETRKTRASKKIEKLAAALTDEPAERLHPVLSDEEVLEARVEARAIIEAKRKKQAKAALIAEEQRRLETEEGLTTGDGVKDQMVKIVLDLAPHSPYIALNGRPYYHGQTYTVARHIAETLREIQQRGWRHQDEIDGKSLTQHYQRARQSVVSAVKGITNAPQKVA